MNNTNHIDGVSEVVAPFVVPPCVGSFFAFQLFTISGERCDPVHRGKPLNRGEPER